MVLAAALGARSATVLSMAAKSVTMPIAPAHESCGIPSLTSAWSCSRAYWAGPLRSCAGADAHREPYIAGFCHGHRRPWYCTRAGASGQHRDGAFAGLAMGLAGLLTAVPYRSACNWPVCCNAAQLNAALPRACRAGWSRGLARHAVEEDGSRGARFHDAPVSRKTCWLIAAARRRSCVAMSMVCLPRPAGAAPEPPRRK